MSKKEKIKVALIDNMNNNFFAMCRYLRDANIDAYLYTISSKDDHFLPQADTACNVDELDRKSVV